MGVALFVRSEQLAIQECIRSSCAQDELTPVGRFWWEFPQCADILKLMVRY